MTRAKRQRAANDVDTTRRREGFHAVDGRLIACCEQGEAMCPCTCHDPGLKLRPVDPPPEAA